MPPEVKLESPLATDRAILGPFEVKCWRCGRQLEFCLLDGFGPEIYCRQCGAKQALVLLSEEGATTIVAKRGGGQEIFGPRQRVWVEHTRRP